ncbi:MAG TPA: hypothetical protein VM933_03415 [Acidimicrobiales bacterium]|nr:hypothetical protein [Acidimicrobiales bacterium]
MSRRWARRLPDVDVDVDCGGEPHRVLLRRGKVVLADHLIAAEAVVVALGASPPPCVDVLRSWRSREQWEIALQPRGPGFHQLYRRPPLPAALAPALERGVVRGWERRAARGEAAAGYALQRALRAKAEPVLAAAFRRAVLARDGGPTKRLELAIGPTPWVSGEITATNSSLLVRVEADWLRRVGLPRLGAGPSGHDFVLAVEPRRLVLDWQPHDGGFRARLVEVDP